MKRWLIVLIVVAMAGAGGGAWWWRRESNGAQPYRTAPVDRGDIVQTVRATGVVQPIRLVQVATQVSGPVNKLYADFNSRVKEGDIVAQIDPAVYEARLAQDEANVLQSEASVEQAQAKLTQAEKELTRSQELARRDLLSQSDLDAAVANRDTLVAQLKVSRAGVEQAKASRRMSKTNLEYTTIRSPVDGVVISRNVDEGQTVVASMSAQNIFQIASDLAHMQVQASIAEADVGSIRTSQPVSFTVDAYPDQEFHGTVTEIRRAAQTVQNVVTYPVIIQADNPDEKLFPGMTANIVCEVARHTDVLRAPNAALRFKPDSAKAGSGKPESDRNGQGRPSARSGAGGTRPVPRVKLWVQEKPGAQPTGVPVALGITDGSFTELLEPAKLTNGQEVITGLAEAEKAQTGVVNPFTPRMPGAGGRPR